MTSDKLIKQLLVLALFQHQHVRILAEIFTEVSKVHFTANLAAFDQPHTTRNRAALDRRLC
jgi:hypothetical protein